MTVGYAYVPNGIFLVPLQGIPLEFLCHLEFCAYASRSRPTYRQTASVGLYSLGLLIGIVEHFMCVVTVNNCGQLLLTVKSV